MSKTTLATAITACVSLYILAAGHAESHAAVSNVDIQNIFAWVLCEPVNWKQGLSSAISGFAGALFTIYFVVGGTIPTPAGSRLKSKLFKLESQEKELAALMKKAIANPSSEQNDLIKIISNNNDMLRDDLERKRNRMFIIWAGLYLVLGTFFATMLAQDLLQALAIGAGWTSLVAALGLSKENKEIKTESSLQVDVLENYVGDLGKKLKEIKAASEHRALSWKSAWDFEDTVRNAEEAIRRTKIHAMLL